MPADHYKKHRLWRGGCRTAETKVKPKEPGGATQQKGGHPRAPHIKHEEGREETEGEEKTTQEKKESAEGRGAKNEGIPDRGAWGAPARGTQKVQVEHA